MKIKDGTKGRDLGVKVLGERLLGRGTSGDDIQVKSGVVRRRGVSTVLWGRE